MKLTYKNNHLLKQEKGLYYNVVRDINKEVNIDA